MPFECQPATLGVVCSRSLRICRLRAPDVPFTPARDTPFRWLMPEGVWVQVSAFVECQLGIAVMLLENPFLSVA